VTGPDSREKAEPLSLSLEIDEEREGSGKMRKKLAPSPLNN